jgi:virginiamycin A acetyltransferase
MVRTNLEGKSFKEDLVSKGNIELGHDVWIGTQCVILSGAKIGTGAVIAANSVVTGEIPPYAIAAGSPAKIIKYRFEEKVISELLQSKWWDKTHEQIIDLFNNFKG